jgi:hypothetical protein
MQKLKLKLICCLQHPQSQVCDPQPKVRKNT